MYNGIRREDMKQEPLFIKAEKRKKGKAAHGKFTIKETILKGGFLPNVTQVAVSTLCFGKTEPKPHRHATMWEVYFVPQGEAIYEVGKKKYFVRPGDFLAIPPNTEHNQTVTKAPHVVFYWGIALDGKVRGEVTSTKSR